MPFKSGIYNMASINHTPSLTPKAANHYKCIVNGRYRILQIVGEGSQGKVYKVEDRQENNKIKAIKEVRVLNLKEFDAAHRETNILRKLNSEFIVKYLEYYDDMTNNFYYMVTEFYEDGTLDQLITKKKKLKETLSNENILLWSTQLLKGIDCLHDNQITHRDLKPANIFLHRNNIVLGDLGLARDAEMMSRTSLAKGVGTVSYMAPELFSELTYTDKIDQWAFGCILYEMIKMKALFEGTIWRILNAINNFKTDRNIIMDNNVPEVFKYLLKRTIVKFPHERASVKELLEIVSGNVSLSTCNQEAKTEVNGKCSTYVTPITPSMMGYGSNCSRPGGGGSITKLVSMFQPPQPISHAMPMMYGTPASMRKNYGSSNPPPPPPTKIGHDYNLLPSDSLQIMSNYTLISGSADKTIKLWNIQSGECIMTLKGHLNDVRCLQMIGSEIIVSGSDDRKIKLWYIKTGECIHNLEGHGGSVYCLQVVRNSRTNETLLISGSADETIKIWNFKAAKCISTLTGHEDSVNTIQVVSEDIIISGSDDKTIKIWNIKTEKCLKTVAPMHTKLITCLEVLSNDILISGSWDCTIKLWSIRTGECLNTLIDHTSYVTCLQALSNDLVISGSRDATIKIWNIKTGQCLKTLTGHNSSVYCLKVTLFKDILFSGSSDTIKVWNLKTGRCINTLDGHSDHVRCLFIK